MRVVATFLSSGRGTGTVPQDFSNKNDNNVAFEVELDDSIDISPRCQWSACPSYNFVTGFSPAHPRARIFVLSRSTQEGKAQPWELHDQ